LRVASISPAWTGGDRQDDGGGAHSGIAAGCVSVRANRQGGEHAARQDRARSIASRDLQEGDETIGISTDASDIEVHAEFLTPGREDEPLHLPPGGWKTAFAFGYALTVYKKPGLGIRHRAPD
jgi:hypothetical protein